MSQPTTDTVWSEPVSLIDRIPRSVAMIAMFAVLCFFLIRAAKEKLEV